MYTSDTHVSHVHDVIDVVRMAALTAVFSQHSNVGLFTSYTLNRLKNRYGCIKKCNPIDSTHCASLRKVPSKFVQRFKRDMRETWKMFLREEKKWAEGGGGGGLGERGRLIGTDRKTDNRRRRWAQARRKVKLQDSTQTNSKTNERCYCLD